MKKLTSLLSKYSQGDLLNLCRNIIIIVERSTLEALLNDSIYLKFKEVYEKVLAVYSRRHKSGMGEAVLESDKARNKAYSRLKRALKVDSDLNSEKGYASKSLLEMMMLHGEIRKLAYARKTEKLHKVLEELTSTKGRQLAEIAMVDSYIDELKESQKTFISMMASQRDADSELRQMDTATYLKDDLTDLLRDLLDLIYLKRDEEGWRDIYYDVNEATEFSRVILKSRKKKK